MSDAPIIEARDDPLQAAEAALRVARVACRSPHIDASTQYALEAIIAFGRAIMNYHLASRGRIRR
jgi:hypothetical protein